MSFFGMDLLNWTVFEQPEFVNLYKNLTHQVTFRNLTEYDLNHFDVTLFSCSLQYIRNAYEMLENALKQSDHVIITRLPIIKHPQDKITCQKVNLDENEFSWPAYFFGQSFVDFLKDKASILYRWSTPSEKVLFQGEIITFQGMLLRLK